MAVCSRCMWFASSSARCVFFWVRLVLFFSCLICTCLFFAFFFSSRRRHTRCLSDWSSDVCSSDLGRADEVERRVELELVLALLPPRREVEGRPVLVLGGALVEAGEGGGEGDVLRSEERRVGKECRWRWETYH